MPDMVHDLAMKSGSKIVLLVLDGLGGLPREPGGATELETARTPNLDALAARSECGLHLPIGFGITPGSAPGHLGLFGYDPLDYPIGRGVVAAMGIGFPMQAGDVAARLNFATLDAAGAISDRRAGRIPTEKCAELCKLLKAVHIKGVEVFVEPVKDYRAVVVFRGKGLSDAVADTDPQASGVTAARSRALRREGTAHRGGRQGVRGPGQEDPRHPDPRQWRPAARLRRAAAHPLHEGALSRSIRSRSRSTRLQGRRAPGRHGGGRGPRRPRRAGEGAHGQLGMPTTSSSSTTSTPTRAARTGTSTRR